MDCRRSRYGPLVLLKITHCIGMCLRLVHVGCGGLKNLAKTDRLLQCYCQEWAVVCAR